MAGYMVRTSPRGLGYADQHAVAGDQEDEMMPTTPQGQANTGGSKLSTHGNDDDKPAQEPQTGQKPLSVQEIKYNARQREVAADKERLEAALRYTEWALAQPTIPEENRYRPDDWVYVPKNKQGQSDKNSNASEQH